jgi:integrase
MAGHLSRSTVRGVHKTISAAATALKIKLGEDVRIPPANKLPGRHGTWTKSLCVTFLTYASSDRLFAAWVLAVVCGMRRGELAALRWRDIDFEEKVVRIR